MLAMEPIPLPSHIHYELLLQLLERQTSPAFQPGSRECARVNDLIATLRKALALQKSLEGDCDRLHRPIDYRWSLNDTGSE